MKIAKLIAMDRPRRLLNKVRQYTDQSGLFFSEPSAAVTLFLDALPHADSPLLMKMLPLLGCVGDDRVLWPLFDLVVSHSPDDALRANASIHLGLAASLSKNPVSIRKALIEQLNSLGIAAIRSSCALSLGWKGNRPAITPLAAHLDDPDQEVRTAVITALASVEDEKGLMLLADRLGQGSEEEQRVIFLHLWRFREHLGKVEDIYIQHMTDADTELQLDILAGLAMLPVSPKILDLYRLLVSDKNARIRLQILENLSTVNPPEYISLTHPLHKLLDDEDARVRQAAIKLSTFYSQRR